MKRRSETTGSRLERRRRGRAEGCALVALLVASIAATACQPRSCTSESACGNGQICLHGFCVAPKPGVEDQLGTELSSSSTAPTHTDCGLPPGPGELRISEVLAAPGSDDDVNGDGVSSTREDEFIELVNVGPATIDLDGVSVWLGERLKHRFRLRCLESGRAIVLFSGGTTPKSTAGADLIVADKSLPIANDGVTVTLRRLDGVTVDSATVPKLPVGHSGVRPDDGDPLLIDHALAPFSRGRFHSAGRCTDGGDFPLCVDEQREALPSDATTVDAHLRP